MKKLIAMIAAIILVLSLVTTSFAATPAPAPRAGAGYGWCGGTGGLMWDDDGKFLSREAFEENLNKAIEDGFIRSEDKGAFLEMYDYCAENGGGAYGTRGYGMRGGCGMGRRWA